MLDSFCGKDGQLQDDNYIIDMKDSVIEAADQISSSRSTDLHEAEPQPATIDLTLDLTASPQKKRLRVDSFSCNHKCDTGMHMEDVPINKALGITKQQFPNISKDCSQYCCSLKEAEVSSKIKYRLFTIMETTGLWPVMLDVKRRK